MFHGLTLPTTTFVATATTTVEPTASQPVRDGGSGMDRLASELKALRVQAQSTEAELAKLHQPAPAGSPLDALRGSEAALAAAGVGLALGALALLWWWRRPRVSRSAGAGRGAAAESSFLPETVAARSAGTASHGEAAQRTRTMPPEPEPERPAPAMPAAVPAPAPPAMRPLVQVQVQDSAFRPSSLDVTFVEHDAMDAPAQPAAPSQEDSYFAAPPASLEFDPEAAANEVERVRKSLAAKRSERSRLSNPGCENVWNDDDPSSEPDALLRSDALFAAAPPTEPAGVDVLIDFPDDAEPDPHAAPAVEADHEVDVGVSLIQELRGLGLWSEARELAKELINSVHAPLDADIASTLHQVQHGIPANGGERRKKDRG